MHDFVEEVLKQYDALSSKLAQKEKRIRELETELTVQTKRVREMIHLLYYINQEIWTLIPLNTNIEFDFIEDEDFREFLEEVLSDKEE